MEKNIEELTLLLMYLTLWGEKGFIRDENYLYFSKVKSITLTHEGELLAEKLMDKYLKMD